MKGFSRLYMPTTSAQAKLLSNHSIFAAGHHMTYFIWWTDNSLHNTREKRGIGNINKDLEVEVESMRDAAQDRVLLIFSF